MTVKFGVKFEGFKQVFIDQAKIRARYESQARRGLGRVGAILRQESRKTIKRRVVTQAMRQRAANAKTAAAWGRIQDTMERRRSTVSMPGNPPVAHVPDHPVASIRAIYFAVAPSGKEVIAGPLKANQATMVNGSRSSVPELMEFGGSATIEEERYRYLNGQPGPWVRRDRRRGMKPWKKYCSRRATYAARPFMGPTLTRQQQTIRTVLGSAWRGGA